ncbi:MAG: molybdopterin cofactor-binding domain-containing protein, partial [Bacteroidia bacterium]
MLQRRQLLGRSAALVVAVALPGMAAAPAGPARPPLRAGAFIRVTADGQVTLVMCKAEMGQGIHTAFAQLLAEELDVPLSQVRVEHAPADDRLYGDATFGGLQVTGGSTSIRASWLVMRQAGADARQLLRLAAAQLWQVDVGRLASRDGRIVDTQHARGIGYGALVARASTLALPTGTPLKPASQFKLIGQPQPRLDSRAKVQGRERFGIDVRLA